MSPFPFPFLSDAQGRPLEAVVPLDVRIIDPEGRAAEFSGHYGAPGGELKAASSMLRKQGVDLRCPRVAADAGLQACAHQLAE